MTSFDIDGWLCEIENVVATAVEVAEGRVAWARRDKDGCTLFEIYRAGDQGTTLAVGVNLRDGEVELIFPMNVQGPPVYLDYFPGNQGVDDLARVLADIREGRVVCTGHQVDKRLFRHEVLIGRADALTWASAWEDNRPRRARRAGQRLRDYLLIGEPW